MTHGRPPTSGRPPVPVIPTDGPEPHALALLQRAERLLASGKVRAALTRLRAARDAAAGDPAQLAPVLHALGQALMIADDLPAMERVAEDLITLGHNAHEPETEAHGHLLFAKAQYLNDQPRIALTALDLAETLYRQAEESLGLAHALRNRGDALYRVGRHAEALETYAAAEALYVQEEDVRGLGQTLSSRGDVLFFLGRNEEARFVLRQARRLLQASGHTHALAGCLLKLGAVEAFLGRTRTALRNSGKALRIYRGLADRRATADAALRRGQIHVRVGDHNRAFKDLLVAVEGYKRCKDRHGHAAALNALSEVLLQIGRFEDSLGFAAHAEALFAEISDPTGRGQALQNLAFAAYQLGRDTEALLWSDESGRLARAHGDALGEANALATMARVLSRLGRDAEALDTFEVAARRYREVGDPVGLSDVRSSSARILRRQGALTEAHSASEEAERLSAEADEPLGLANARATRGQVLFAMGRIEEGTQALLDAREVYTAQDARWNLPLLDMELARLLSAAGRLEDARVAAVRALDGVEALRAMDPSARTHADLVEQFSDAVVVLCDVLRALGRVEELILAMEPRRAWTLTWLQGQSGTRTRRPTHSTNRSRPAPTAARDLPDLQGVLSAISRITAQGHVTLVWYPFSLDGSRARCLLGTPESPARFLEIELDQDQLAAAVSEVLSHARSREETGWSEHLSRLGTLILAGRVVSEEVLGGTAPPLGAPSLHALLQRFPAAPLGIVTLGLFSLVPWAALRTPNERYLVEDRESYMIPRLLEDASRADPGVAATDRRAFCFGLGSRSLHWTEREAREVASLLSTHGRRVSARIGPQATRRRLSGVLHDRSILHFATHAEFDAQDPFRSFLQIGPSDGERDRLWLLNILDLRLSGATAVLSACSTAVTDASRLFDPVSLSSAFLAAGCERVIGTLWEVDDASTSQLMRELYQLVLAQNVPWGTALREVQLRALRGDFDAKTLPAESASRGFITGANVRSRARSVASALRWGAFGLIGGP